MRGGIPRCLPNSPLPRSRSCPTVLVGTFSGALDPRTSRTKMSHAFTKRLLPLTRNPLSVFVPAAERRGSSRCSVSSTVRAFWEDLTREDKGFTPFVLRPAETARRWEGAANDILARARGHAKLFALRPRSVRPSHVPSGHPRPLHARPPSEPGHRYAETEVDGVSRDGLMVSSRASPYPPRDQRAR